MNKRRTMQMQQVESSCKCSHYRYRLSKCMLYRVYGSNVWRHHCTLCFQYYGHREKLKLVGREDEIEKFNRQALKIARQVADETGTLMAGNICNTTIFVPGNAELIEKCRAMFKVHVTWPLTERSWSSVRKTCHAPFIYAQALKPLASCAVFARRWFYSNIVAMRRNR